jgi:UDP-N-acetylglucosamine 4-epimerase
MNLTLPENIKLNEHSFLVTGGAGFIGSNLVEFLLTNHAKEVRVLDNFATGRIENISDFFSYPNFKFIEGDIRDIEICKKAIDGVDYISHQAALGSVPRSINDPITTNSVNVNGFLNILTTAKDYQVKRMVYASSSSVYGNSEILPKIEGEEGNPMSPYALSKKINEEYARVFSEIYGFHAIGLRYFNVFGPKQNPDGDYAAVIPRFIMHAINGTAPTIYGDGLQARDFTYVENAVQANIKAFYINEKIKNSQVYNVACGESYSIIELWEEISNRFSNSKNPIYEKPRNGDVRNSLASLEKSTSVLKYYPSVNLKAGLEKTIDFYLHQSSNLF